MYFSIYLYIICTDIFYWAINLLDILHEQPGRSPLLNLVTRIKLLEVERKINEGISPREIQKKHHCLMMFFTDFRHPRNKFTDNIPDSCI